MPRHLLPRAHPAHRDATPIAVNQDQLLAVHLSGAPASQVAALAQARRGVRRQRGEQRGDCG
eukprot:CAMPEP_0202793928 /NCGR_PEP_ID=MMETSP1388-20130828/86885_1 /ASSEMBLY_ACC=CAM_ASM_000864 /TAXON_ID=37098 /ORGANISM="Isochrysis sp, Strain CCMP1244" /LENGTH=61 /DNA_ID=CAMNT_0049463751 /DNA_START=134 /DNA_END=316 /DNA_ORIENTATION=-